MKARVLLLMILGCSNLLGCAENESRPTKLESPGSVQFAPVLHEEKKDPSVGDVARKVNLFIGEWLPLSFAITAVLILFALWGIAERGMEIKKELAELKTQLAGRAAAGQQRNL
jgi:hypothetical protein